MRRHPTQDAETIVVALGFVAGTPEETVDAMRAADENIGLLSIRSYRPSALAAVRTALQGAKRVVVLEKKLFCRAGRRRVG